MSIRALAALALFPALAFAEDEPRKKPHLYGRLQAAPPVQGQVAREGFVDTGAGRVSLEASLPVNGVPRIEHTAAAAGAAQRTQENLWQLAQHKLGVGDFGPAVELLSRLISQAPREAPFYTERARAYNELARHDEARADALIALKLDPTSSQAWAHLAYSHASKQSWLQALRAADEAIKLDAHNPTAHFVRYLAAGRAGDMQASLAALEEAARYSPKYSALNLRVKKEGAFIDPDAKTAQPHDAPKSPALPLAAAAAAAVAALGAGGAYGWKWAKERGYVSAVPASAVAMAARKRQLRAKYDVKHLIGRGGMGDVYEGQDLALERPVAIKRISESMADLGPDARRLLAREAKTVAGLHHPAIVDIYEIIEDKDELYLIFEFVQGQTASQLLAERGRLPFNKASAILRPVCKALEFAHSHGLVHRDLKPANIMVTGDGYVKLMDFGIAKPMGGADNALGAMAQPVGPGLSLTLAAGTPPYMAPESEEGVVSRQTDIYSLGVCLYELLTGRLPFSSTQKKLAMDFPRACALVPSLPPGVDELLASALEPDPKLRLRSVTEFSSHIEDLLRLSAGSLPRA